VQVLEGAKKIEIFFGQFFGVEKMRSKMPKKSVWMFGKRVAFSTLPEFLPLCSGFYLAQFCTLALQNRGASKRV